MHEIVETTARICRRHHGVELDRPTARLAVLTVVDHLDAALDTAELAVLAGALPLALSLMIQRRAQVERTQFDLAEEAQVRSVCDALAQLVQGPLRGKLQGEVAEVLLGRRPASSAGRSDEAITARPAAPIAPMSWRPTVRTPAVGTRAAAGDADARRTAETVPRLSAVRPVLPALRPTNVVPARGAVPRRSPYAA
jgi:hypothetical protein